MNLTLSSNDHLNATYTEEDGTPLYQVTTPFSFTSKTATIKKAIPEFAEGTAALFTADHRYGSLAHVEFHAFVSSIMRIDGEEVKTSAFFTKGRFTLTALGRGRTFVGPDRREYQWILGHRTPTLVLNDEARTLVAKFHVKHYGIFRKARPPFLEISQLGMHMVDLILITFVYIEKLRRDYERARNRGVGS
ncbi:hypothetical protein BDN72DRAFT_901479 [Pluteus cervinus]|uniref:Uncharacterized protein n=1 Tax=Pluteus cervinus TaxID=181527 RepID=A0ACD3AG54_9AGAR|nr:hypothetical protein BDN72DRAFT_901479 [Pluteus cervinus]